MDLIWGSTMMVGIAVAMIVMDWSLALIVLSVIPLLAWLSVTFQRIILRRARVKCGRPTQKSRVRSTRVSSASARPGVRQGSEEPEKFRQPDATPCTTRRY
ncbi:MAG: hypothetical protein U5O39_13350 [Gammaproteobacteria bacterium]|nr:hypothetical protein [Gammaproteobacteria bacterium]